MCGSHYVVDLMHVGASTMQQPVHSYQCVGQQAGQSWWPPTNHYGKGKQSYGKGQGKASEGKGYGSKGGGGKQHGGKEQGKARENGKGKGMDGGQVKGQMEEGNSPP